MPFAIKNFNLALPIASSQTAHFIRHKLLTPCYNSRNFRRSPMSDTDNRGIAFRDRFHRPWCGREPPPAATAPARCSRQGYFYLGRKELDAIRVKGESSQSVQKINATPPKLIKYIVDSASRVNCDRNNYGDLLAGMSLFCRLFPHSIPFCVKRNKEAYVVAVHSCAAALPAQHRPFVSHQRLRRPTCSSGPPDWRKHARLPRDSTKQLITLQPVSLPSHNFSKDLLPHARISALCAWILLTISVIFGYGLSTP